MSIYNIILTKRKKMEVGKMYKYIGEKYNTNINTTEIAKRIREQLKKEFPDCKFSVRSKYFSGGSEIKIVLMKASFKIVKYKDISEIPFEEKFELLKLLHDEEIIKQKLQELKEGYFQLSYQEFFKNYKESVYSALITEEAFNTLKRVVEMVNQYRRIEIDIQTDYINTNFYLFLSLGEFGKPFIEKA